MSPDQSFLSNPGNSLKPANLQGAQISRRQLLMGMAAMATLRLPLPAQAAVGIFEPFSFAFVTDVHLTNGLPDSYELVRESQLFLQDIVKQLNLQKDISFVIFGGDQVQGIGANEANWQLFLDIAQGINVPWSFILGEQDISGEMPVDKMRTFGPDWKRSGVETDKPYWSMSPLPSVHLIGLDTSLPDTTIGDISPHQLEWLKQELLDHKRKFNIVFSHHPLLPPPPYDDGQPWDEFALQRAAGIREVLGSSPFVHLAVSGHVHVSKVQQERDIWYVSCPSLAVYPCAYRIFKVTPDDVTIQTYSVGYPALIKKARRLLIDSDLAFQYDKVKPASFADICQGSKEDQNSILSFDRGSTPHAIAPQKLQQPKNKEEKRSRRKTSQPKAKTPPPKVTPAPSGDQ